MNDYEFAQRKEYLKLQIDLLWKIMGCRVNTHIPKTLYFNTYELSPTGIRVDNASFGITEDEYALLKKYQK